MKKMRLRTFLTIFCFFFAVIIIFSATYLSYQSANELLTEQVYAHLETTTQSKANHIETFFKKQKDKIMIAATHQELTNEELKELVDINSDYTEMFVLDSNGIIVSSSEESIIGVNKSDDFYFIEGQKKTYFKDIYFSDSINKMAFAIFTPHGEGNVLVVRIDTSLLNDIVSDKTGLGETGEAYMINKDKLLITSSRFFENNILVQKVDTTNAENCLSAVKMNSSEHRGHEAVESFLDYRGENVIGTHVYISEMQWCLLAEVDEAEILGRLRQDMLKDSVIISIILILIVTLIMFFIGGWLENVYLKKGRQKSPNRK